MILFNEQKTTIRKMESHFQNEKIIRVLTVVKKYSNKATKKKKYKQKANFEIQLKDIYTAE